MCPEITIMKGRHQKDTKTAPIYKKKWSKSKRRTFLPANIGERRRQARAWTSRRPHLSPDRVDRTTTGFVPSAAMAPRNTTQYLMDIEYAERLDVSMEDCDLNRELPTQHNENDFSSSDSAFDRSLNFQQRDFENMLFRNEI